MTSKNELRVGYAIGVICLLIGVVCYGALPAKAPEIPVRIMLQSMGGNVLFDHQTHSEDYGLDCEACHHSVYGSLAGAPAACGSCHRPDSVYLSALDSNGLFDHQTHSEDFGLDCIDCHHTYTEDDPGEPEACGVCHNPEAEGENMPGREAAFHEQCISCHEASEVIPGGSDCAGCHKPRPRKDAFHEQCMNCHEESGAGPGRADCKTCHGY